MTRNLVGTSRYKPIDIGALLEDDSNCESDLDELVDEEAANAGWVDDDENQNEDTENLEIDDDSDIVVEDGAPQRKRRKLLKDKLVHDLASCLDIDNYDEINTSAQNHSIV